MKRKELLQLIKTLPKDAYFDLSVSMVREVVTRPRPDREDNRLYKMPSGTVMCGLEIGVKWEQPDNAILDSDFYAALEHMKEQQRNPK